MKGKVVFDQKLMKLKRTAKGITQESLAAKMGYKGRRNVWHLENSKGISIKNFLAYCEALGADPTSFFVPVDEVAE